jgi:hypothetical protein
LGILKISESNIFADIVKMVNTSIEFQIIPTSYEDFVKNDCFFGAKLTVLQAKSSKIGHTKIALSAKVLELFFVLCG